MTALPTVIARDLDAQPAEQRWLIDRLWADQAVGIVGGEPKCCKSFLALDMAVSVSAGAPCLGRFPISRPGRALVFAAEDALHVVRERLQGIALERGTELSKLDVHVITAPTVRLDLEDDRKRLQQTVASLRPKLLVLDPFVRLHRRDENISGEVAPLLAFLRDLQRRWKVAVAVVHHARKGASKMRAGQALRGSSEFHAWGDSNLYLRRQAGDGKLDLTVEHRAAPALGPVVVELRSHSEHLALGIVDTLPMIESPLTPKPSPQERILAVLANQSAPMTLAALRDACKMKTQNVTTTAASLVEAGRILRVKGGYLIETS